MHIVLLLMPLVAGTAGVTPPSASPMVLTATESATPAPQPPDRVLGIGFDVGVPDGAGLTLLYRPLWWLRLNGGMAYNVLGFGIRGGATLIPYKGTVTLTANFDIGHYFSGNVNNFVTVSNTAEQALLKDAAYDFWSAQLGLEIGSRQGFVFYLRGGIAHIGATLPGQDLSNYLNSTAPSGTTLSAADANFSALLPCFSLGFLIFVY